LIAKLLVHRNDRATAIACMKRALSEFVVEGVKTTIPLHRELLANTSFVDGLVDTTFIERYLQRPSK
jgi:acetyl-CoA carboxylase, biotin carboxylase subunit